MKKIAKILNISEKEAKAVVMLLVYSFFVGVALAYFVTSSTSLFLNIFERKYLPIAFIVAGVLVWLVGKLMNYSFRRFTLSKSIPLGIFLLLSTVLILLAFLYFTHSFVVIFLLYAWIRVFAYLHAVVFWSLSGRLFSIRQAKKVFGLITGGEVFASILSFFSVPFLLKILQTSEILLISGIFLTLGFFFMLLIVSSFKQNLEVKKEQKKVETKKINLFETKYFKMLFWMAFIPIFAQFFVDFIFQAQAKVEFPDREALTAFVGLFFGVSAIVEFTLKTFISGRVLYKYGIKVGLLAFPLVLGISFFLASVLGVFYGTVGLFFSMVAIGRLFTRAVRTSFNDPSNQILYQPIPPSLRVFVQNKIESGPKAYASILAGVTLLIISQIPGVSLVVFAIVLFIITVIWAKLALNTYQLYKSQVQNYLSKTTARTNKSYAQILIKIKHIITGENKKISEKLARLYLPYNFDYGDKSKYKLSELVEMSYSKDVRERIIAADKLANFSYYKVEKLYARLLNDEDFEVRNTAIIAAGRMKDKGLFNKIIDNFKLKKYRRSAINAILNIGEPIVPDLIRTFNAFEYDTDMQIAVIDTLAFIKSHRVTDFFRTLLNYPVKLIREQTIAALAKMDYEANKTEQILIQPFLEDEIKDFVYVSASLTDLQSFGSDDFLVQTLEKLLLEKKHHIFDILAILYSRNAVDLIRNNLLSENDENKGFAIEIADNVLSELHKMLLLPIFEGATNLEVVRRYKYIFPQEVYSVFGRIVDLINAPVKTTGIFVKVEAIRKLQKYKNENTFTVLNSAIVSPVSIIAETAAYTLFMLDRDVFDKTAEMLKNKNKTLERVRKNLENFENQQKFLLLEKISLLKGIEQLKFLDDNWLYNLALNSVEIVHIIGTKTNFDDFDITDVLLIVTGKLHNDNGIEFEQGDFVVKYFFEMKNIDFDVVEPTILFKIPLFILDTIFMQNIDFAELFLNSIIKKSELLSV